MRITSSVIRFLGNYAGRSASEWMQRAVDWASKGSFGNLRDAAYNYARALLGSNASWDQIKNCAESLIRSLTR